ncbi:uncharacterized protein LOC130735215 [Lotus japonicus]|uniref:uncharacterized protein LOC130735215 n=1 Tax=Lotus japonicus TaxID=34305 RepID=UPI002589A56E|nr:uncharacterized protein LOC130735215 [Lotus japonicus]
MVFCCTENGSEMEMCIAKATSYVDVISFPKSYEVDMLGEKVPEKNVEERQLANVNFSDDVPIAMDYTEQFTTDTVFATRDEVMDWVKGVGKQLSFVIIIRRSDCGSKGCGSKSRQLAILGCEMGGKYKPYKPELKRKGTGTKKCDCPFRLKARRTSEDGLWRLTVVRGDHNHKPAENLHGHAYVGRLTSEEKEMVGKRVDNKVKLGNMLLALKSANPQKLNTIRQVYNERMAHMRAKRGALTKIHHLMRLLEEDKVEGAHAKLKACIKDSKSDLCAAWAAIHRCTLLQHTKINVAFQDSIFIREHTFKEKLYDNLRGLVSRYALMLIAKEKARVGKCGCTIRRTHDLPCSCQLAIMASIPLMIVDQHWRRLTTTAAPDESQPVMGLSITTGLEVIAKMFEEANVPRKQAIKERLQEIAYPD